MRETRTSGLRRGEEAAYAVPLLLDFSPVPSILGIPQPKIRTAEVAFDVVARATIAEPLAERLG
jgi:hypothetical protein